MGLLRFAGDVWKQGVDGIKSSFAGKIANPGGVMKDVASDAAEAFIPVDFDRWGARANKFNHYSQSKPIAGEVSHQANKGINAIREPVVQSVVENTAKGIGLKGSSAAVGTILKPVLQVSAPIEVTGAVLEGTSQAVTGKPAEHHALRTARAMDEGRSLGDVWQDGDWDTEMPRRIERARSVFDPSSLEFGITELMHGN